MIFSYYPGCTLKTKAKDLDKYAHRCAAALGITLEEIPDWQCCGGTYPMAKDEIATKLSSVRALASAKCLGQDLVTVCSACHNVIKQVNNDMRTDQDIAMKVNNYIQPDVPYRGETRVIHYLEMLRNSIGFDKLKEKVVNPLNGKRIAAYYGCLLLRPSKVMKMDNPENPTIMEDLIRAIGGTPVVYPFRNECCGGYVTLEDKALAINKSNKVLESAESHGAELMITACPLCLYNLNKNGTDHDLPVIYFTELLAEALGVKESTSNGNE
ncbi:CoB--CoM heterodisulfide reductase iron-sulfur subunit B family protein [Petroclostridium sp. X23]|uniref:CoB--CoM heterodisulfide reductase iron-sulfur subunit B family protein n=1 Tax=Petroclostridium sp. X23 TaxID=3045146 RepID=UPI0024AE238F|nr:CoB--CoM heterodisulfide reductase iron-sulfur subunit B family protein [Petroclostridium sp. X23]WHH60615.1 CoB--CoM heterodisulfide reductase iron-sulfur subunit B family protein [Petroclostridium sp. X23]